MNPKSLLRELCGLCGVSGYEKSVRDFIRSKIVYEADQIVVDPLGNLISSFKGESNKKVMFAAHMDEKGFVVRRIREDGLIEFSGAERLDVRGLPAQILEIHTREGIIKGVVDAKLEYVAPTDPKPLTSRDLVLDIGAVSSREVTEKGITIGDPITFDSTFHELTNQWVASKAVDNRASLTAFLLALTKVKTRPFNIILVATSQEELGKRGAASAAFSVSPDVAIVLDIMGGEVYGHDHQVARQMLGKGPIISIEPDTHPTIREHIIELAERAGIPYQRQAAMFVGTDVDPIQRVQSGILTASILIPTLHFHTPKAIVDLQDIANTAKLLTVVMENKELLQVASEQNL